MADRVSVIEDLAAFAQRTMPRYIPGVRKMWSPPLTSAEALRDFFERGPGLLVEVYYGVTGRELWIDVYDAAKEAEEKPPNIKEIGAAVLKYLIKTWICTTSKQKIEDLARQEPHRSRRGRRGMRWDRR